MFSRAFSSVPINDSAHEMLAGLCLLDHRSDSFFTCISGVDPAFIMWVGGGGEGGGPNSKSLLLYFAKLFKTD